MDVLSFDNGVVTKFRSGNRVKVAGLKGKNRILRSSHRSPCVYILNAEMDFIIHRDGKNKTLKW